MILLLFIFCVAVVVTVSRIVENTKPATIAL